MRLQSEDGRVTKVLGDSPQDQKRAKILLADRWVMLPDAPEPAVAEEATEPVLSPFDGMTKADLAAHLEACGVPAADLKGLKKEALLKLAQDNATLAEADGEGEPPQ
jgi:hypothetical protein